jgi:signal transduction histidine kinase
MRFIETNSRLMTAFNPGIWSALEWSPELLLAVFDQLHNPILVLEEGGKIILCNSVATRLLDIDGLVGSNIPTYLQSLIGNDLEMSNSKTRSVTIDTCEGSYIFVVKPLPLEGTANFLLAEGIKEHQYWAIKASNHDGLDQGVAMAGEVSQKVKGPLAGIELYASILDEEITNSGDNSLKDLINEIRNSLREVNEYLTSLESMTRDINLDLGSINLIEVIDESLANMSELFKAKNVGVWFDQKPVNVLGDRRLLKQLFMNIFLNAVEAMPSGGRLMIRMSQDDELHAEVVITDTGPGIEFGLTNEIYNPFYTTKGKALGLGLPVSRRIIEAHDGHINVGSDLNTGARVSVSMPGLPFEPHKTVDQGKAKDLSLN